MPATVILNPYANRWGAGKQRADIEAALQQAGVNYTLHVTEKPGHAIDIARLAAERGEWPLVAAGGDGTLNEVVNGLQQSGQSGPLGVMPVGSANDLVFNLKLPNTLAEAAAVIAGGQTRPLDVGQVNGRYFVNNSAIGVEALVGVRNASYKYLTGTLRYMLAALVTVLRHPHWHMKLTWPNGAVTKAAEIVSVGNSPRTGGAFFMTPGAKADDGLLDMIMLERPLGVLGLLRLLPMTLKGTHIGQPHVNYTQIWKLNIEVDSLCPIHADGELLPWATEVQFDVLPGAVQLLSLPTR